MKKLISLLLVALLLCSALPAAALTAEERYERMEVVMEFIKLYGIDSPEGDDPLARALMTLFEDEESYNLFMDAMLGSYDSHTMFIPADSYDDAFPTTSSYVGVGITMQQDGEYVRVVEVAEGGSAQQAGILPGDLLYSADGVSLKGKEMTDVSALLRGEEGTSVDVTVLRGGRELSFTLTRAVIGEPNFSSHLVEDGIYYMKWTRFFDTAAYIQFVFSLQEMTDNNCRALILDLRGNPGGDLNMAYNVINRLLPDSLDFFGYCYKQNGQRVYESVKSDGIGAALNKIIILSDGDSASASEVVQASLCDLGYAVSVGKTTYGKARGQYHLTFPDNSAAVLTSIELIAPSTADYEGIGLAPDYDVDNYTVPHPAAQCAAVPEQEMTVSMTSKAVHSLNAALSALGYLDGAPSNTFTLATLAAVYQFQSDYQLPQSPVVTVQCVRAINAALDSFSGEVITVDAQYEKALELARYYAAQPQQYVVDELGNVTNLPREGR